MITVALDHSPLHTGHAIRGVGNYTRQLVKSLKARSEVTVVPLDQQFVADVVHYPYFDLFYATLPFFKKKPTVVTIHDVIPLLFPSHFPVGIKGRLAHFRQRWAVQTVAAVITDSEASKQDIHRYLGIPDQKIQVVYLAGNPELVAASDAAIDRVKSKYHLPKNYILYVGDINYSKNIPQLIKALKYLPESVQLVCVGSNFSPYPIPEWQAIEQQLALSNVAQQVQFVTDIKADQVQDLAACYSGAVAYVQPSLAEGFGLPILEAMQCHTPVIASHNSSLIEVGGDVVEWVEPVAESIADGIKRVFEWPASIRADKIQAAYQWSQKFSWAKTASNTIDVYRSIAKTAHD